MNFWALTLLIVAPTAGWAAYHNYKDRFRPEPGSWLLLAFALGIGSALLADQGYALLDALGLRRNAFLLGESQAYTELLVYAVFGIGAIEELAKFLPFWILALRNHHFDEPIDGIIYAAFVALGFASVENLRYLAWMDGLEALARGLASPMVHVLFASIWGYACGWARCHHRGLPSAVVFGLALAIAAHGLYDFLVIGFPHLAGIGGPLLIGVIWGWRLHLVRRLQQAELRGRLVGRLREWVARRNRDG